MHCVLKDWQNFGVGEVITHICVSKFFFSILYVFGFLNCISSKNNAYFVFKGKERDKEKFKRKLEISSMMW